MSAVIDSRQLLAFATLARRRSFTNTARELCLTQSAVSHAIKTLEQDLGAPLFNRVGKTVHLTEAGERLLATADGVLRAMREARDGVRDLKQWGHGRLRVGASTSICQYLLPTVLREFKQSFPACELRVEPGDGPRMVDMLRANQVDVALMLKPARHNELVCRRLFDDELKLIVSPQHRWAAAASVNRADLGAETLILYNKGSYTFTMIDDFLRRDKIVLQNFIELGSMEAIKELVKIGLGAGIFAPWIAQKELAERSLVARSLGARRLRRSWVVAHLKGRRLSLAEETFIGLCESVAETAIVNGLVE